VNEIAERNENAVQVDVPEEGSAVMFGKKITCKEFMLK
jgi:hypothetical protein